MRLGTRSAVVGLCRLIDLAICSASTRLNQGDKQASREGKKSLNAFVEPEVARQLKKLSADLEKTQQELFIEALNDLFVKYGKAPIA